MAIRTHGDLAQDVTRIPFDDEKRAAAGWLPTSDVSLYAMEVPIHGNFGEVAEHFIASRLADGATGPDVIVIVAADADGVPLSPVNLAEGDETHTVAEVIAALGLNDVTAA